MGGHKGRQIVRFLNLVETKPGCWLWRGGVNNQGYGQYGGPLAHRLAYELLVGPVPDGLVIDHLCKTPLCVNPDHLEPVTQGTNVLRDDSRTAKNAIKTHCDQGHEFTVETTYWRKNGDRDCRPCKARRERERRQRLLGNV